MTAITSVQETYLVSDECLQSGLTEHILTLFPFGEFDFTTEIQEELVPTGVNPAVFCKNLLVPKRIEEVYMSSKIADFVIGGEKPTTDFPYLSFYEAMRNMYLNGEKVQTLPPLTLSTRDKYKEGKVELSLGDIFTYSFEYGTLTSSRCSTNASLLRSISLRVDQLISKEEVDKDHSKFVKDTYSRVNKLLGMNPGYTKVPSTRKSDEAGVSINFTPVLYHYPPDQLQGLTTIIPYPLFFLHRLQLVKNNGSSSSSRTFVGARHYPDYLALATFTFVITALTQPMVRDYTAIYERHFK